MTLSICALLALAKVKAEVVMKVCAKYFDEKEDLVMVIINLMYEKIVKTSFMRRLKLKAQRLGKFFSKKSSSTV